MVELFSSSTLREEAVAVRLSWRLIWRMGMGLRGSKRGWRRGDETSVAGLAPLYFEKAVLAFLRWLCLGVHPLRLALGLLYDFASQCRTRWLWLWREWGLVPPHLT